MDNLEDIYELSPMQQGMLFHSLYAPESGVYCEQMYCTLHGKLNIPAFQRSWQQVINHHPILRTAVYWDDLETPLQVVLRQAHLPWQFLDWQALSQHEQQDRLQDYLQADSVQGFDFAHAPLMRLTLAQTGEDAYYFIWSYHHLLLDGWSLVLVLGEVFTCYDSYCQNQDPSLAYRHPYKDYIAWLQQQDLPQAERFWRQMLAGFQQATPLPIDQEPAALSPQHQVYEKLHIALSQETTEALRSLARQHQLTLSTLIQGAWALLLSRYSGQKDVVFGTTVSGRPAALPGVESMIGLFINTLPMRVQVPSDTLLLPWLQQLQDLHADIRQYEYTPLVQIQGWSAIPRGTPLFESIVVFENFPARPAPQQDGKLKVGPLQAIEQTNYPLSVLVAPLSALSIQIYYDSSRFEADAIERLLRHLKNILESMVTHPHQRPGELSWFSTAEYEQIAGNWHTAKIDTRNQCLHHLFEQQAEQIPDAVAIIYESQHLTFRDLDQRANQFAHYLQRLGVGPEVLVGVYMDRSLDLIISLLAISKAGGAYLPLDPQYPPARLALLLNESNTEIVITQQRLQPTLAPISQITHLICLESIRDSIEREVITPPFNHLHAENLAYVIYTSGSTGNPKGVAITHRSAVTMITWALRCFTPDQYRGMLAATSICFDLSVFELWLPFSGGGTVLLASDLLQVPSLPSAQAITLLNTVPSALAELLRQGPLPETVQTINLAGEALPVRLVRQLYDLESVQHVYNLYGPTEDTTYSTWALASREPGKRVPIGKPVDNTRAYVLDEQMHPVPPGIPGELYLGGEGLARGYLHRPDSTAERFLPNPFGSEPGQRIYRTGDLACYRPDGELEFLGRRDEQVKLRGYRIEPGEIEAMLNQHPDVQQCVVIMRGDRSGDQQLVAYVVPHQGKKPLLHDLRTTLQIDLPLYMVPSTFVLLEALPRTISGKIDRKALPSPENLHLESATLYKAPQTELEETIASVWREVLQREKVGVHDNFFDLGGHSLHLIRVQSTLNTTLNKNIPLLDMFKHSTVSALAKHLSGPPDEETPTYQSTYDRAETRRASMQRQRQQRQRRQQTTYNQSGEEK